MSSSSQGGANNPNKTPFSPQYLMLDYFDAECSKLAENDPTGRGLFEDNFKQLCQVLKDLGIEGGLLVRDRVGAVLKGVVRYMIRRLGEVSC